MKAKITSQLIASLSCKASLYEVNDTELKGFQLRVMPTGTKTFYCVYRLKDSGRKNRYLIGRTPPLTPAQARDEARKILGDVTRGTDPNKAKLQKRKDASKPTLLQFIDKHYAPWAQTHFSSPKRVINRIKVSFSRFLDSQLSDITALNIDKWKAAQLEKGLKATSVNRDLASFRSALTKAVEWEFLTQHPIAQVKSVKVLEDHRIRYLTDEEEERLRLALDKKENDARAARKNHHEWCVQRGHTPPPLLDEQEYSHHLPPMILISLNTGLRRGELFNLLCSDIDLDKKQLKVRAAATKNKKARYIPLNEEVFNVFEQWFKQHPMMQGSDFIFPSKDGGRLDNVRSSWESVLKCAQIENFRWHDMRHHFASRLVMAGVDLNTVRELLGHADLKMTLRYAHLAPEHKALAVAKLNNRKKE